MDTGKREDEVLWQSEWEQIQFLNFDLYINRGRHVMAAKNTKLQVIEHTWNFKLHERSLNYNYNCNGILR